MKKNSHQVTSMRSFRFEAGQVQCRAPNRDTSPSPPATESTGEILPICTVPSPTSQLQRTCKGKSWLSSCLHVIWGAPKIGIPQNHPKLSFSVFGDTHCKNYSYVPWSKDVFVWGMAIVMNGNSRGRDNHSPFLVKINHVT